MDISESSETLAYKPEAKLLSNECTQELSLTLAPGVTMELVRIPPVNSLWAATRIKIP